MGEGNTGTIRPLKCGFYEPYVCPKCRQCYHCRHLFQERLDGWWVKCPTGKWFKVEGSECCHGLGVACKVCGKPREIKPG